jgi:hypothetical protein
MRATVFHDPFDVQIEQVEMPHCRSQRMPSFGSPMPASVDRMYGPTEAEKWRSLSPWTDGEPVSGK